MATFSPPGYIEPNLNILSTQPTECLITFHTYAKRMLFLDDETQNKKKIHEKPLQSHYSAWKSTIYIKLAPAATMHHDNQFCRPEISLNFTLFEALLFVI